MEKKIQIEYSNYDPDKALFHTNFLLVSKNIIAIRDATSELPLSNLWPHEDSSIPESMRQLLKQYYESTIAPFTRECALADEIFALDGVVQVAVSCYTVMVLRSSKLFGWEPIETSVKKILQKYDPTPKLEDLENLFNNKPSTSA